MLLNVSLTMVVAPLTFLWDGRWQDPSSVPGGGLRSLEALAFTPTLAGGTPSGSDTLTLDVCTSIRNYHRAEAKL